jgi:hypothetical protein
MNTYSRLIVFTKLRWNKMPIFHRAAWGFLAGLLIVLLKIQGPDQSYVRSLFSSYELMDAVFYVFISLVTISLGLISGLFSKEREPVKLLVFCASIPALLSTATSEQREAFPVSLTEINSASIVDQIDHLDMISFPSFISSAHAQTESSEYICVEDNFLVRFSNSAQRYVTGESYSNLPFYAVVAASTTDFELAKEISKKIFDENAAWAPFVGCRRPGNDYFPIIVGNIGTKTEAIEQKTRFEEESVLPFLPELSFYEYRTKIFVPN